MENNYEWPDTVNRMFPDGNGWEMLPSQQQVQSSPVWLDKSPTMSAQRPTRGRPARRRNSTSFRWRHPTRGMEFQQPQQPLDYTFKFNRGHKNETCSRTSLYGHIRDTQRHPGLDSHYHESEEQFNPVHQTPEYVGDYDQHFQKSPNWTRYVNHKAYFGVQAVNDCVPNELCMTENQQVFQPINKFPATTNMMNNPTHERNQNNPKWTENFNHTVRFGTQSAIDYSPNGLRLAENQSFFQPNNEFSDTTNMVCDSTSSRLEKNPNGVSSTSDRTVWNNSLNGCSHNDFFPSTGQTDILNTIITKTLFDPSVEEIQNHVPEHKKVFSNEITSSVTKSKSFKENNKTAVLNSDFLNSNSALPLEMQILSTQTSQNAESLFPNRQQLVTEENLGKSLVAYNPPTAIHGTNSPPNRSIEENTRSMTSSEIENYAKFDENVYNINDPLVLSPDSQSLSTESVALIIQQNQLLTSLLAQVASNRIEFQKDILTDNLLPSDDTNTYSFDLIKYLDPAETENSGTDSHMKPNSDKTPDVNSKCELSKKLTYDKDDKLISETEQAVLNIPSESFVSYPLNYDDVDSLRFKSQISDGDTNQIEMTLSSITNYLLDEPENHSQNLRFSTIDENDTLEVLPTHMVSNSTPRSERREKRVKKLYKRVKVKTKKSRRQRNAVGKANPGRDHEELVEKYFAESFETNYCAPENESQVPNNLSCDVEVQVASGDFTDVKTMLVDKQNAETQWEDVDEGSEEESEWLWMKIKSILKYSRRSMSNSNKDKSKAESCIEEPILRNKMCQTVDEAYHTRLDKDSGTEDKGIEEPILRDKMCQTVDEACHTRLDKDSGAEDKGIEGPILRDKMCQTVDEACHTRLDKDSSAEDKGIENPVAVMERIVANHTILHNSTIEEIKTRERSPSPATTSLDGKKCKALHLSNVHNSSLIEPVENKNAKSPDSHPPSSPNPISRKKKSRKGRRKSKLPAKNVGKSNKTRSNFNALSKECSIPNKNFSRLTNETTETSGCLSSESHLLSQPGTSNNELEDNSHNGCRILRKRKKPVYCGPPSKEKAVFDSDFPSENEIRTLGDGSKACDIVKVTDGVVPRKASQNRKLVRSPKRCRRT